MALKDRKITETGIATHGVSAAPDRLVGTAAENKKVFDNLVRNVVAEQVNGLVDDLMSQEEGISGAEQVGFAPIAGVVGGNIRAAICNLKEQIDNAVIGAGVGGYQYFKREEEPGGRMKGYLYGKILADYREVN